MSDTNTDAQEALVPDENILNLDDIAAQIDALTSKLAASWRSMTPDKLDQIAELMGQHEALLQLQAMPADRLGVLTRRVVGRTFGAKDQVGAQLIATLSELDVYARHLAKS